MYGKSRQGKAETHIEYLHYRAMVCIVMTYSEIQNGKPEESPGDKFWLSLRNKLKKAESDPVAIILSPRQERKFLLMLKGVPKFQKMIKPETANPKFCIFPKGRFDQYFHVFAAQGLISFDDLEDKYKDQLPPDFMNIPKTRADIFNRLWSLVGDETLCPELIELWERFTLYEHVGLFLEEMDFHSDKRATLDENTSSIVEKYIYALWMTKNGFSAKKRNKGTLAIKLSIEIYNTLEANPKSKSWQFAYYKTLLNTEGKKLPLIRTVTDMTPKEIRDYAQDNFLTYTDFPELFSTTRVAE